MLDFLFCINCIALTDASSCLNLEQLWAYEVLRMYPPESKCTDLTVLPRAHKWSKGYMGKKEGRGELNAYRLYLDDLRASQV